MSLPKELQSIKTGGDIMAWSAIGEVIGNIVGLAIPNPVISDSSLGNIFAILFGALNGLGLFKKFKTYSGSELNKKLSDIDNLFISNKITQEERNILREKCLKDYQKKL